MKSDQRGGGKSAPNDAATGVFAPEGNIGCVMDMRERWELMSYIVTVIGLPFALLVFIYEQRKERRNEDEEIFQRLSDEYREFLKLVLDNADLQLLREQRTGEQARCEND